MLCFGRSCEGNTYISRGDHVVAEVTAELAAWNPIWQEWQPAVPFPWSCCCCAALCWLHPVSKDEERVETQRCVDDNLFSVTGSRNQWSHWGSRTSSAIIHQSFQWGIQKCYEWIKTDGNTLGREGGRGEFSHNTSFQWVIQKSYGKENQNWWEPVGRGVPCSSATSFQLIIQKSNGCIKSDGNLWGEGRRGWGSWCSKRTFSQTIFFEATMVCGIRLCKKNKKFCLILQQFKTLTPFPRTTDIYLLTCWLFYF